MQENLQDLSSFFTQTVKQQRRLNSTTSTDSDCASASSNSISNNNNNNNNNNGESTLKRKYSNSLISEGSSTLEDFKGFSDVDDDRSNVSFANNDYIDDEDNKSDSTEREDVNTQIEIRKGRVKLIFHFLSYHYQL